MPIRRDPDVSGAGRDCGLVLMGGGARAAYQVGVLSGILQLLNPGGAPGLPNPFGIVCGTSAGAINAAVLACRADTLQQGVDSLANLWGSLHAGRVYRADAAGLLRTGLRWFAMLAAGWLFPGLRNRQPRSLLDNTPLGGLLRDTIDFRRLQQNLDDGHLQALAIMATSYTTGQHLAFYQSRHPIRPWQRSLRRAVPTRLGVDHLLASSSIPFVFPAQALDIDGQRSWCGDGSMRQLAPVSPAIHLGANRLIVIGTGYRDDIHPELQPADPPYPSLAQIAGHALSNIFLDSLSADVERTQRLNELLAQVPVNGLKSHSLRALRTLIITPSQSLDEIALAYIQELPRAARALFRVLGVSPTSGPTTGGALISYLLFEASYTKALIQLGRSDCLSRSDEIHAFFKEASE